MTRLTHGQSHDPAIHMSLCINIVLVFVKTICVRRFETCMFQSEYGINIVPYAFYNLIYLFCICVANNNNFYLNRALAW